MNESITYEELEKVLNSHHTIRDVKKIKVTKYNFSRHFSFSIHGVKYEIEWFSNYSTLYIGRDENRLSFLFDDIQINGYWPNAFKNNLCLVLNRTPTGIIPLDK